MPGQDLSAEQFAGRMREHRSTCRNLIVVLVHRSWRGGTPDDAAVAGLVRVMSLLEAGARETAGEAPPDLRGNLLPWLVSLVAFAATVSALLVLVPQPAAPVPVTAAMYLGAMVSGAAYHLAAAPGRRVPAVDASLLPATDGDSDPVRVGLGEVRSRVAELLPAEDPSDASGLRVAEHLRHAHGWLGMVIDGQG